MDSRWQDWVITIALVALTLTGVATVFGDSLLRLWQDETTAPSQKTEKASEGTAVPAAPGPAAGPF
jgi:hypothetical protein